MDLRRQEEERGYNPSPSLSSSSPPTPPPPPPPPLKDSTFSRPLLPLNSSLLLLQQAGHKRDDRIDERARNGGGGARRYSLTPSPFNSVSLRPHAITTASRQPSHLTAVTWHYRECQRNHAAGVGGHVVDGCCEFMPGDDVSLKCAACGCHRSFHRKEPSSASDPSNGAANQRPTRPYQPPSPSTITPSIDHSSSTEEMQISPSKKRFRTKFTPEQKEKMLEFADRLSWKFQKTDDTAIDEFCKEEGLSRQVFKVWMHNNKYTYKKQEQPQPQPQPPEMPQQEDPQHEHQQQQQIP